VAKFSKIDRRMHGDEKFRRLSRPGPNAQSLWQFLLTGQHNTNVPGVFVLGEAAMAEHFDWPLEDTKRCFAEILDLGMARYDRATRLVWLPNALRHNQPESANVVVSWRAVLPELPECALREELVAHLRAAMAERGPGYAEAFRVAMGEAPPKPSPNPSGKAKAKAPPTPPASPPQSPDLPPTKGSTKAFGEGFTYPIAEGSAIQEQEQEHLSAAVSGGAVPPARADAHEPHVGVDDDPDPPAAAARRVTDLADVAPMDLADRLRRRSKGRIGLTVAGTGERQFGHVLAQLACQGWTLADFAAWADLAAARQDAFWEGEYTFAAIAGKPDGEGERHFRGLIKCLEGTRAVLAERTKRPAIRVVHPTPAPPPADPSQTAAAFAQFNAGKRHAG
jgi:hypothetical protein